MRTARHMMVLFLIIILGFGLTACTDEDGTNCVEELTSSRSYSGHEIDLDTNNFVNVYPDTVGKRLDDCQTCHRAGIEGTDTDRVYNSCDYCHLLEFPNPRYETGVPGDFADTLNAYGLAYLGAGRTREAIFAIRNEDADGDGYTNQEEILSNRYPGDASSTPGQILAPMIEISLEDILAMESHSQFMLMNTTKQQFDDYVTYQGIRLEYLLVAAGVDLHGAEGITVYAPDGFGKDFSMEEMEMGYPKGTFYMTPDFPDPEMELVNYPDTLPDRVQDQMPIPDSLYLMLATHRDGALLDTAYYDSESGKLEGEGPYRLVMPQKVPSRPDRGLRYPEYGDGWDFQDDFDHNAGSCVRGACVIRVNPMPAGMEEFDWKNGWSLITDKKVIIYGHGVPMD